MSEDKIDAVNQKMNLFYRETGVWPPGRSMPAAMCGGEDKQMLAHRTWELWIKYKAQTSLADELAAELNVIKRRFSLNHYITNIASEVNADVVIRIEDLLAKVKEMGK